jgi:signal transduction histidine kinase
MHVDTETRARPAWWDVLRVARWSASSRRDLVAAMLTLGAVLILWAAGLPKAGPQQFILIPLGIMLYSAYRVSSNARVIAADTPRDRMPDIIAEAAHDLRTPVFAIQTYAQLLLENRPPAETQRQWTMTIRSEAQRLERTLDDILDLNRLQNANPRLNCADHDLSRILDEVMRPFGATRTHRFHVEAPPHGLVHADGSKLIRALTNLIANAMKYSPRNTTIHIRFAQYAKTGTAFEVSDEGAGIPEEEHERIFEPFFRGSKGASTDIAGAGLGLAIVRAVAKLHGGEIMVRNRMGAPGAVFTLTIGRIPGCPHVDQRYEDEYDVAPGGYRR